jgi:hypothetical protein
LWDIILKGRKWPLYSDFLNFLAESGKKAITQDTWQQLWHFSQVFKQNENKAKMTNNKSK